MYKGKGRQPLGTIFLMEAERSYHFDHWLHISKKHLCSLILCTFYHDFLHIALVGADNPMGPKFWCQQEGLITLVICCKFQENLFNLWFYTHLNDLINVYSHGSGADNPQGTIFHVNRNCLSLVICYKFQKNLFEVWFYTHFFSTLYVYIAPKQGQTTPWGQNFDVNRNILPLP